MSDTSDPQTQRWHIDRRIPLATILALVLPLATGAYFMGGLSGRVDNVEKVQGEQGARIITLEMGGSDFRAQLARMTALLESIDQRLARQERRDE